MISWPSKDPDEVLDYAIDWSARLGTDTITSSTWVVPDGISPTDQASTSTSTSLWLSGGTAGASYVLTNQIETSSGRAMDQSVQIDILNR